jgi:hypothetical protein
MTAVARRRFLESSQLTDRRAVARSPRTKVPQTYEDRPPRELGQYR